MEVTFCCERRIEFADTDMAGITHFANYFRYMEEAEHAFLRSRGLSVVLDDEKGKLGFPKLSATCDYSRPLQYEELVQINVHVHSDDGKTICYDCRFCQGARDIASGQICVAFCRFPPDKPPYAIPLPEHILQQLFRDEM